VMESYQNQTTVQLEEPQDDDNCTAVNRNPVCMGHVRCTQGHTLQRLSSLKEA
jgi:hypothetical protein